MLWKTHVAIGAAVGSIIAYNCGTDLSYVPIIASAIGSLLPDVDTPNSKLGMKFLGSQVANRIFGHRGFTHSLMGCVLFVGALSLALPKGIVKYIGIGYISHLVADMLNPAGIPLLWPKKARFRLPVITTGSVTERFVLYPAALVFLAKSLVAFMAK